MSGNEVELDLLQYVSDFRTRLSKVCKIARQNLESAQTSMKARYDKKAAIRKFEPGDQVLALLPIPGKPLQARYSGPYIIKEKLSDLNYILKTPERQKRTQLCHINMLKPYFKRKTENCVHSISVVICPDSDNKCGDPEEHNDFYHYENAKLQNSNTLKNLDSTLLHLSSSRLELQFFASSQTYFPTFQVEQTKSAMMLTLETHYL